MRLTGDFDNVGLAFVGVEGGFGWFALIVVAPGDCVWAAVPAGGCIPIDGDLG